MNNVSRLSGRRAGDFLLLGVTSAELTLLVFLTPTFTFLDWIYVSQHLVVLGIAFTRRPPEAYNHSLPSGAAVLPNGDILVTGPHGIFEDGELIAAHAPLEGRGEKRLDPAHRKMPSPAPRRRSCRASARCRP